MIGATNTSVNWNPKSLSNGWGLIAILATKCSCLWSMTLYISIATTTRKSRLAICLWKSINCPCFLNILLRIIIRGDGSTPIVYNINHWLYIFRMCYYLISCAKYVDDIERDKIMKLTYDQYLKYREYSRSLILALQMNHEELVNEVFMQCRDKLVWMIPWLCS